MVKISTFMLCGTVTDSLPGLTTLVQPAALVHPPFIPGVFSFGISIGLTGLDTRQAHSLAINIFSPDGKNIFSQEVATGVPERSAQNSIPAEMDGVVISMDIDNLTLLVEGIYKVKLTIDNRDTVDTDMPVYRG